jgi:ATP-dependent Clp protease ATP-binding subunit ClpB
LPHFVAAVHCAELGLASPDRPRGTFLLVGPTGTGKTELALSFSDYLFGPGHVHRFDLSEYQSQSGVEKLIGTSPSDRGLLGRVLASHPCGTLLFDELEKAHSLVLDLFLQLLDPGRITLATGETLSSCAWYIVFTSNLGSAEAMRMERSSPATIEAAVLRRVSQSLRPEFGPRINEKLVFARLTPQVQREICELLIARETARLRGLGHDLTVSRAAMEFLVREGFHPQLGARPMRRTVERHLQEAVVRSLFAHGFAHGKVEPDGNQLQIRL